MWAVLGALIANVLITILKFAAAIITGSSGLMAESLHSLADTTNQIFLLLGLSFYRRPPSAKHPFGYGMERFFWSFIAAIFIFGVGATYALYEGYEKLRHPHPPLRHRKRRTLPRHTAIHRGNLLLGARQGSGRQSRVGDDRVTASQHFSM